ncbi:MAG: SGNH/GDSL hydrolase family protein [Sedimentisphaerales bacterium]|nr:SGNH/GDSL hydrolase family protein [Sedimentisphaerales bacterium]
MTHLPVQIGNATEYQDSQLYLTVPDVQGTYTIPYIQSSRSLNVRLAPQHSDATADLRLKLSGALIDQAQLNSRNPAITFTDLTPGEYELQVQLGPKTYNVKNIGIGSVIAALGDSLTEGYYGQAFRRDNLELTAADFPPEAVSKDRRNFPQFAPTACEHWPEYNCFTSWMTRLNDLLSQQCSHPVFITNEGWGGINTTQYLDKVRNDTNWQQRIKLLQPSLWLIHLGVNDDRCQFPAALVRDNLAEIIRILQQDYNAQSQNIYIAKPSYDYHPGAAQILQSYISQYEKLITQLNLKWGADFYTAFSTDRQKWYGDDTVHPNEPGINHMAEIWSRTLAPHLSAR